MEKNKLKKKTLSIIIVTYKSMDLLKGCIDSILKFNDIDIEQLEIIIVDNSPKPDAEKIEQIVNQYITKAEIIYIKNENLGYGQGNNVGVQHAKGNIIAIMNPDIILIEPIFKKAITSFKKNSSLAMLGGKQYGARDISFYTNPESESPPLLSTILMLILNKLNIFLPKSYYLSGAFLFFDKKKFIEAGAFDEKIFMYYEEPDISKRILNKKYQINFDKTMKYKHLIDERSEISDFSFNQSILSFKYYCKKYNFDFKKMIIRRIQHYKALAFVAKIIGKQEKKKIYINNIKRFEKAINNYD